MRYAARRDGNAGVILDALRKAGFTVMDFSLAGQGIPDALVTRALPDGTPLWTYRNQRGRGCPSLAVTR